MKTTAKAALRLIQELETLKPLSIANGIVLDNGCGTGATAMAVRYQSADIPILATDISPGMLDILDKREIPGIRTRVADALDLSVLEEDGVDNHFSHVLSTFMIQFTPDATKAVAEMYRVLQPGGAFGLATWIEVEIVTKINEAGKALEPQWKAPNMFASNWPTTVSEVQVKMEELGFVDIHTNVTRADLDSPLELLLDYTYNGNHPSAVEQIRYWEEQGRLKDFKAVYERSLGNLYAKGHRLSLRYMLTTARKP
ncbi:S-adenosyl-L-methionine-dependent methyltransferase [Pseudovirgaria hyperparasitica]|uniref:S-adenosyl-L-methionine-dependent methyltransferase n=1 Tax=Pseudovirgaria hyperparasitica TaxID=470096 RepID=A0A6A6WA30_9PEZI|nr:S-adenosyl-L-methionine-dependent methyltransferase [Pseudovirgaria hyperparasitica]KAF2759533.1 S-adenosyl-L-methionine-dependent methyltransferase [Pseudovirgaria hyperparasitica]